MDPTLTDRCSHQMERSLKYLKMTACRAQSGVGVVTYNQLTDLYSLLVPVPEIAAAAAKSLQSCPTVCDPIDGSPPGSPIPGILQARTLEWAAIAFSNA